MSLVAFSFMVGGAIGTAVGGRVIIGTSYRDCYMVYGLALVALSAVALAAVPSRGLSTETHRVVQSDAA
jgi:predicted MFS family arabinose efflux permease